MQILRVNWTNLVAILTTFFMLCRNNNYPSWGASTGHTSAQAPQSEAGAVRRYVFEVWDLEADRRRSGSRYRQ